MEPTKKNPMSSVLSKLEAGGFDINSGLYYCNSNTELYAEILANALEESAEKRNFISGYRASGSYSDYYREVHALKNVMAMIGATEFTALIGDLCQVMKNTEALPDLDKMQEFDAKYEQILQTLALALEISDS